jgi:ABC-2 type transport system ATP-binding protein
MSGLDPIGRKQVRDLILGLREQGKTVFFSTHIIPDVEVMCDRVGIVVKGKLLASGTVDELVSRGQGRTVDILCDGINGAAVPAIAAAGGRVLQRGTQCSVALPGPDRLEDVLAGIRAQGGRLVSVTPQRGSLEELFFQQLDGYPGGQV